MPKDFEPFERERTSTVSRIQGTGLGMAITKNIVDMMGGTIEVQTAQGKGSEFIIRVPMRAQAEHRPVEKITELEGLKALVVDDDFNTCDSVTKMLVKVGMRAEWTLSGKEAVLRARQSIEMSDVYHAYIIDWRLPDMNGIEVTRQIRSLHDDTPIIILTAYDWSDIEVEAKAAGVTAFCSKPMFMSDLRETLMSAIGQTQTDEAQELLPQKNADFKDRHILLVEDNALNREIAQEILREYGFRVDTAENGEVAVEKVSTAAPGSYDLVLMDVQMPVMDGYTATRKIRALENPALAGVPILAMTANAFDEDRRRAMESGMNGFLSKPIVIGDLPLRKKYRLNLSEQAKALLAQETPKALDNVTTRITGSVRELCAAAASACRARGYEPVLLTDQLRCEAREAGSFLGSIVRTHARQGKKLAYIAGGETVVHLTGKGTNRALGLLCLCRGDFRRLLSFLFAFSAGDQQADEQEQQQRHGQQRRNEDGLNAGGVSCNTDALEILRGGDTVAAHQKAVGVDAVGGAGHQGDVILAVHHLEVVRLGGQYNGDLVHLVGQHPVQHRDGEGVAHLQPVQMGE